MITVHSYGLHWLEGDIAYLVQQDQVDHILDVELNMDVKVVFPVRKLQCPHYIRLETAEDQTLPPHPLIRAFLPLPKKLNERITFIEDTPRNQQLVNILSRLSSPVNTLAVQPVWMYTLKFISAQLHLTNVQPLVLHGHSMHTQTMFEKIASTALFTPRRLVMMAPKWVALRTPNSIFYDTKDLSVTELEGLPLERIGAHALRSRMMLPKDLK